MKKNLIALLLAVAFVLSVAAFAGCAKTEPSATKDVPATSTAPDGEEPSAPAGDPVELNWIMGYTKVPADQEMVEEKLNELSVAALNTKCHTKYMATDACMLALQSGEDWDIAFTANWYNNFSVQAHAGYFADITEKVKTLTPALYESIPEQLWSATIAENKIYAVPVNKDWCQMNYWRFDKALMEELKIDYTKYTTFESIEEVLKAVKEAKPDTFPLMISQVGISTFIEYDMFNDDTSIGIPYSAVGTDAVDTIVCTYFQQQQIDRFQTIENWYKAGYINSDANVTKDIPVYSAVKSGQGFYGADSIWTFNDGYEQVITMYSGPYYSTGSARVGNAISANSDKQDAALKYLEYVCTNQEYTTILRYGIPEYHWNLAEEGTVKVTEKGTAGYTPWAFSQGNYTISIPAWPAPVDMWDHVAKDMEGAKATNSMGFALDITPVENEVAACKGVIEQYKYDLAVGSSNVATKIPEMQAALKTAGIDTVLAEAQKQYNTFLGK